MRIIDVDPIGGCAQLDVCAEHYISGVYRKTVAAGYIGEGGPGKFVIAYIDLHVPHADFLAAVKRYCKGNVIRDARKSDKLGYLPHRFEKANFIPDMCEINHSKAVRCGRAMDPNYRRSVEALGGAPTRWTELRRATCPTHWRYMWGVFKPEPGYKQGDLVVDEKLLGYISLYRSGNYAQYAMLLGHGDYLKDGIMYRLHFAIMEWLYSDTVDVRGLDFLWYAGWHSGGRGLQLWKKKAGFTPGYLTGRASCTV